MMENLIQQSNKTAIGRFNLREPAVRYVQFVAQKAASNLGVATESPVRPVQTPPLPPFRRRPQVLLTSLPLLLGDAMCLVGAMALSMLISRLFRGMPLMQGVTWYAVFSLIPLQLIYLINGLYPGVALHAVLELRAIVKHNLAVLAAGLVCMALMGNQNARPFSFSFGILIACFAVPVARSVIRKICGRYPWWGLDVLVVGSGAQLVQMVNQMRKNHSAGLNPVAVVDLDGTRRRTFVGVPQLASVRSASKWARASGVGYTLLSFPNNAPIDVSGLVQRFSRVVPHILIASGPAELPALWRDSRHCGSVSGIEIGNKLSQPLPCIAKRVMDLTLVLTCSLMILPLMVVVMAAIRLSSPGPIFYGHNRIGQGGRRFKAWKFRSMIVNSDAVLQELIANDPSVRDEWLRDQKLKDDPRVTWIGKVLRKTSLDELPQLWNVLKGEMSLVGPRPIVNDEVEKYGRVYRKYKTVKPGLTGLWQVSGRNNTTYDERVAFDQFYVRNWSPWLDVYLIARTIKVLVFRSGAY